MDDMATSGGIRSLSVENFTAFSEATLNFSNLNVIVGDNETGKTHLLKMAYSILVSCRMPDGGTADNKNGSDVSETGGRPTVADLEPALAAKLAAVFRPKNQRVGRLVRRRRGYNKCSVKLEMADEIASIKFGFSTRAPKIDIDECPSVWHDALPVFLPTQEMLALPPEFLWLYKEYVTEFDETWRDTRKLLGAPSLRGRPSAIATELSGLLKKAIDGSVMFDKSNRRFYLRRRNSLLEILSVAEGTRRVGTLSHLAATGQLNNANCLFWDMPESNLNPKTMRVVADAISRISRSGTQVFLATHSLFMLRELELLQRKYGEERYLRYFALEKKKDGVVVNQADDLNDIDPLTAQDEVNAQSERLAA